MFKDTTALTPSIVKSAIIRHPLVVTPDTAVMSAITQMSAVRSNSETELDEPHLEVRASCVLVVEDGNLLGIFTEQDVVRLSAEQRSLEELVIREVMSSPVISS